MNQKEENQTTAAEAFKTVCIYADMGTFSAVQCASQVLHILSELLKTDDPEASCQKFFSDMTDLLEV